MQQPTAERRQNNKTGWSWRPSLLTLTGAAAFAFVILLPFLHTFLANLFRFGSGHLPDWSSLYLLFRLSRSMALLLLFWMFERLPLILGVCTLALISAVLLAPALRRRLSCLASTVTLAICAVALGAAVGSGWSILLHFRGLFVASPTLGAAAIMGAVQGGVTLGLPVLTALLLAKPVRHRVTDIVFLLLPMVNSLVLLFEIVALPEPDISWQAYAVFVALYMAVLAVWAVARKRATVTNRPLKP